VFPTDLPRHVNGIGASPCLGSIAQGSMQVGVRVLTTNYVSPLMVAVAAVVSPGMPGFRSVMTSGD